MNKIIDNRKKQFTFENRILNKVMGWSDRCPNEFSCTSFIYGLQQLGIRHDIEQIHWNFGAPNHGKDMYDRIGGVVKYEYANAVWNGLLKWNINQAYELQIKMFMDEHFISDDDIDYKFYNIESGLVYERSSHCQTLKGIKSGYQFVIYNNNIKTFYRTATCYCIKCMDSKWEHCVNLQKYYDQWITHIIKHDVDEIWALSNVEYEQLKQNQLRKNRQSRKKQYEHENRQKTNANNIYYQHTINSQQLYHSRSRSRGR